MKTVLDFYRNDKLLNKIWNYTNMTSFPINIYQGSKVMPLAYFKRDILPDNNFEFKVDANHPNINPNVPGRYSWNQFSNSYGNGIHPGKNNTSPGCGGFGRCNNSMKPQRVRPLNQFAQSDINTFARTHYESATCDDPPNFISENTRRIASLYSNSIYNN